MHLEYKLSFLNEIEYLITAKFYSLICNNEGFLFFEKFLIIICLFSIKNNEQTLYSDQMTESTVN